MMNSLRALGLRDADGGSSVMNHVAASRLLMEE